MMSCDPIADISLICRPQTVTQEYHIQWEPNSNVVK